MRVISIYKVRVRVRFKVGVRVRARVMVASGARRVYQKQSIRLSI